MDFAFTGPRSLTAEQELKIYKNICPALVKHAANWHVGDAPGLDAFIRRAHPYYAERCKLGSLTVYEVAGTERRHFAERSKRMIDALPPGSWLHAFPNKPCPPQCRPCKNPVGGGSGTWLTIAYAKHRGIKIDLHLLVRDLPMPGWLFSSGSHQLALF